MNEEKLPHIDIPELSARTAVDGSKIHLHFIGTADARATDLMGPLLTSVHAEAQKIRAQQVTVDFRQLDFMSSSCLKAFVTWIGTVRELGVEQRYRMRFVGDATKYWQRRSLDALRGLASELIEVKVEA